MRPDSLFWVELMEDSRRRRSLVIKFVLPVALILPLLIADVPSSLKFSALPLLVLFMGVLGASVGLSGMRERGMLERLSVLPVAPRKMIGDYIMANVAMDSLQMIVPSVLLVLVLRPEAGAVAVAAIGLLLCIFLSNELGVLMAIAARGTGEVHLYSGVCVLLVGGASGLFMGNAEGLIQTLQTSLPFGLVSSALSESSIAGDAAYLAAATIVTLAVLAAAIAWSTALFRKDGR
jgi:ABC-type transport system involved in cytochrome c biogenesis permease component